ncbi:MAG: hypothetical protein A3C47_00680 [Omnitrophica bacterium RIFCSPHIGHO2_02_FULL_51_18]|nr:MAG: hypothetical protein A3C47_00680 [Omnitrophica bacterium RIFCSPHIGHO2_02_FULL_51_18]
MDKKTKNILLGVTASIAAYKACDLITDLREAGFSVRVVLTKDASYFITPLTLQSLSGQEVVEDFFSLAGNVKPVHIELAKNSDLILIAPASADIIAKLAHGLADDVLTCTALASDAPLLVAPAMNEKMYLNKFTQGNLKRLEQNGVTIIPPIRGHLVCMDKGIGHIAENKTILETVKSLCKC